MWFTKAGQSLSASDRSAGFASVLTTLTDVSAAAFAFILAIATAHLIGPSGRGEVTAVISLCALAYLIGTMGLASANVYFAARKSISYPTLFGNSIVQGILLGAATTIVLIILVHWFPSLLGSVPTESLIVAAAFFPLTFTELYLSYLIIGRQRFFASNMLLFVSRALSSIVILVGCLLFPEPIVVILLAQTYSIIRLGLNLYYMQRSGLLPKPEFDFSAFKTALSFAVRGRGTDIFQFLNLRFDIFVLNALSTTTATGIYSIAVMISEIAWFPSYGAAKVLFPTSAAASDSEANLIQIQRTCRIIMVFCAALAFSSAIAGYFLIPILFGSAFTDARVALWLLLPGTICFPVAQVLSSALSGRGLPHIGSLIGGGGFVLTLVLDLLLIPHYEANGAAIASSIAYAFTTLLAVVLFTRTTHSPVISLLRPTHDDLRTFWAFVQQGWVGLKGVTSDEIQPTV